MMYAAAVCVMYYVCMYVVSQKNGLKERYDAMLHMMNFLKRERMCVVLEIVICNIIFIIFLIIYYLN